MWHGCIFIDVPQWHVLSGIYFSELHKGEREEGRRMMIGRINKRELKGTEETSIKIRRYKRKIRNRLRVEGTK
jgi:hypothetical protein